MVRFSLALLAIMSSVGFNSVQACGNNNRQKTSSIFPTRSAVDRNVAYVFTKKLTNGLCVCRQATTPPIPSKETKQADQPYQPRLLILSMLHNPNH